MTSLRGVLLAFPAMAAFGAAAQAAPSDGAPKLTLDLRTRYESYDPGPAEASALTVRLRAGVQGEIAPRLTGLVEVEAIGALLDDYGDGIRPSRGFAVIPDPEIVELNRAQLTYAAPSGDFRVDLGRQRIVLNNARFIANSGWRQNEQTFDAVRLGWSPVKPVRLTYGYIDNVARPSGRDHPLGILKSDSHIAQVDAELGGQARASGYAYLLRFANAPSQSTLTTGLRYADRRPLNAAVQVGFEAEYARQTDAGPNPANLTYDYGLLAGSLSSATWSAGFGLEQLGGDSRGAFQTPLASLHGFQGWSDVIGATPAHGLRDLYLRGGRTFPGARPVKLAGELHAFRDDTGQHRVGREYDASASVQLTKAVGLELGVARFETAASAFPDATRGWITVEYKR